MKKEESLLSKKESELSKEVDKLNWMKKEFIKETTRMCEMIKKQEKKLEEMLKE